MKLAKWERAISGENPLCDVLPSPEQDNLSFHSVVPEGQVHGQSNDSRTIRKSAHGSVTEAMCSELSKANIKILSMSVSDYIKEVLSPENSITHDIVLTEPPLSLSTSEGIEAVGLCKWILKPGCAFFAIVD